MLNQTQIDFLEQNAHQNFFRSLRDQYLSKGTLSPNQIRCLDNAITNSATPTAPAFSLKAGELIEIKGWLAKQLEQQLALACFFRNLEITEVVSESPRAYSVKVKFVSKIASSCHCCGRDLDTEVSRATGIGPVCASRLGLPRPTLATAQETLAALETIRNTIGEVGPVWIPKSQIVRREELAA